MAGGAQQQPSVGPFDFRQTGERMNVDMHGLDRAECRDYTDPGDRTSKTPPFVAVRLVDGNGSQFTLFLVEAKDAYRLAEVAREAMDILGTSVS